MGSVPCCRWGALPERGDPGAPGGGGGAGSRLDPPPRKGPAQPRLCPTPPLPGERAPAPPVRAPCRSAKEIIKSRIRAGSASPARRNRNQRREPPPPPPPAQPAAALTPHPRLGARRRETPPSTQGAGPVCPPHLGRAPGARAAWVAPPACPIGSRGQGASDPNREATRQACCKGAPGSAPSPLPPSPFPGIAPWLSKLPRACSPHPLPGAPGTRRRCRSARRPGMQPRRS